MKKSKVKQITTAALVAALYTVLTYISSVMGLSSGAIQLRFSEALCVLPVFTPYAIPGLFAGCAISNFLAGGVILDVVFGSIATLVGAIMTRWVFKRRQNVILSLFMPVVSNVLIVPWVIKIAYGAEGTVPFFMFTVGLGEIISCVVLGYLLYKVLQGKVKHIFK